MWQARTAAVLAVAVLVGGCSGGDDASTAESIAPGEPAQSDERAGGSDKAGGNGEEAADGEAGGGDAAGAAGRETGTSLARVDPAPRDIIYTIDLRVEVDDVAPAAQRATVLATSSGGFVASESTTDGSSATLTLRVPSEGHQRVVEELEALGEIRERHRSAEDVTEEVVDVESRIASQRRSINRIRALLDEASEIQDIISIESELARREADLESLLERQEQLAALTSMATVTVTFTGPNDAPDDGIGFLSGLRGGWEAFMDTLRVAAATIGAVLPFAAMVAVLGVPFWLLWRRRQVEKSV